VVQALESESGVPLADADRWSERLGADVSGARVATGPAAAQAAASIDANAFTVGNRVFFGAGKGPHTRGGALLRHELAHVVQQASAHMPPYEQLALTTPGDAFEREADGSAAPVQAAGQAVLARDTGPDGGIDAKEWV
jgi:hypothetical protein